MGWASGWGGVGWGGVGMVGWGGYGGVGWEVAKTTIWDTP